MTIVSARSGYDPRYYAQATKAEQSAGGYYISPAQHGEAAGRWFGRGAEALGFRDGQEVAEDPYLKVYQQVDPRTGEKLGRSPGGYAKFEEILARKLAAEPHATAERVLELEREAARETRRSPAYTDTTVSLNKSVSILKGSMLEKARRARLAGDQDLEALWRGRAERLSEIEQEANHAALVWAQEHAGFVRTGYHGKRVDGVEPGRWERAAPVVTTWLQGTSRDGDPHDHLHNVWARMALTESDGKWRALDTMALRTQLGTMAAIVEVRVRSAISREFGVSWEPRADGDGYEIAGVTQREIDAFSQRTRAVSRTARKLARQWEEKYGRAPNAREMKFICDEATYYSRHGKDPGLVDWDQLAAKWDATIGGTLAEIADRVCDFGRTQAGGPTREQQQKTIEISLAKVQATHSTWTRSDLMRQLSWQMGPEFDALPEDAREEFLHTLTEEALSVSNGVVCLEAPEFPAVPPQLIRDLDGRSVYTRPGTTRYACKGQLSMEEKLCQQAQAQKARVLTREFVAEQLGAEADQLDAQLTVRAQDAHTQHTHTGLRYDQAAMIYQALTSPAVMSVGVGPAGSGKTHTAAAGARAWEANGGHVIGITCSQAARNVLARAGIRDSWNSAKFLGHLEAGKITISPGTLFVIDEGSMMSMAHLGRVVDLAERTGGKVFLTGDHGQLTAVESGGGMRLAARHLGYMQLSTPVRFHEEWERDASLRLRLGDATALEDYNEHGRILGANREEAFDQARRAYVADRLDGQDTLLMAYTREDCRALSRMIRDDLVHLGLVDDRASVGLSHEARASAGDMIVCRENDNQMITDKDGGEDHTLANGDIFRIKSLTPGGAMVRRVLEAAEDGSPRYTESAFYPGEYLRGRTDLAYAVTGHNGQGGTVGRGLALVTGHESREWLYVASTRGRQRNTLMAVTRDGVTETRDGQELAKPQKAADPAPGTKPDPELERAERVERERAGFALEEPQRVEGEREPIAVLADALEREDAELSATETQRREMANADHLGILGARWADLADRADRERHERMILGAVPEEHHEHVKEAMTWISRSLTTAELAGLDPEEVVQAATVRPLEGLEHAGKGLQARLARMTDALVPLPEKPFAERVPEVGDPEVQEYVQELGTVQDERRERLGEHAAELAEPWAVNVLGPVPEDPLERLEWEERAGWIGAYGERYGRADDNRPIGNEPTNASPRQRAAWHRAQQAITRTDGIDFRSLPDRSLVLMAESYRGETAWAPPHVGRQLRDVRLGRETMRMQRIRAEAEAQTAGDQLVAWRHSATAREAQDLEARYAEHERILAEAQADRETWEKFSEAPREIGVQAQAEIQRRNPKLKLKPLESAEPVAPREGLDRSGWLAELEDQRAAFREELERRQGMEIPDEDPDCEGAEAWPQWRAQKEAILQPPAPEIRPAEKVMEAQRGRDGAERGS